MSSETQLDHFTKSKVVYELPGAEAVTVRREVEFRAADGEALTLTLYAPPMGQGAALPAAVVVVAGYPDAGFRKKLGCSFEELRSSISWARLLAASGMVAVTYTNREPAADLHALLAHLRANGADLGSDGCCALRHTRCAEARQLSAAIARPSGKSPGKRRAKNLTGVERGARP